jgi:putative flippase GtrA
LALRRIYLIGQEQKEDNRELRPIFNQFVKFASVGVAGTLVQYTLLIVLVQGAELNATLASTIGFTFGAFTNYYLNYYYTFASDKNHTEAIAKFFTVALVGMFFNGLVMHFCTTALAMPYLIAQVTATCLVLLWTFSANRWWTFRQCKPEAD